MITTAVAEKLAPPQKFTDVMIDIEGCSDLPDAAPHQIGVAFFDLLDPARAPLSEQYDIEVISCLRLGMSITGDTLVWWNNNLQKPVDLDKGSPIRGVLKCLADLIRQHAARDARVWSRGNTYDLAILKLLYRRTGLGAPPWDFWRERDVRSHLDALGYEKRSSNPHVAMEDALNQVRDLHAAGNVAALKLEIEQRKEAYEQLRSGFAPVEELTAR